MAEPNSIIRPAGAVRIRTYLNQHNYNIEVIDYFVHFSTIEIEELCNKFITPETIFVGASITFLNSISELNFLFKLIKEKFPHVKTIIGGTETDYGNLDLNNVDNIIWGYAEETILHYLDFLTGKRLDNLPWMSFKQTQMIDAEEIYKTDSSDLTIKWLPEDLIILNYLPIEISRGCIFRCRFCQYPLLGKKKSDYIRYEDNLVDEFKYNWEQWGITNYSFQDDTFNDNIIKLEKVANAIAKSGVKVTYSAFLRADLLSSFPETIPMLAETGLIAANFGIESLNIETKKIIGKGVDNEKQFDAIRKLKKIKTIYTFTGMIVGLPRESIESIKKSQQWFKDQNNEVFDMWQWWPLGIRINATTRKSDFDKNYKRWGYDILDIESFYSIWKNEYMTFFMALDIAKELNKEIRDIRNNDNIVSHWHDLGTTGMFEPAELVGLGITIDEIVYKKVNKDFFEKSMKKIRNSIEDYKILKLNRLTQ